MAPLLGLLLLLAAPEARGCESFSSPAELESLREAVDAGCAGESRSPNGEAWPDQEEARARDASGEAVVRVWRDRNDFAHGSISLDGGRPIALPNGGYDEHD